MESVLRAESISKSFGPIEVLSGISLDLKPGEVHAVIGENGAGKSTLMRILSGHLAPTKGNLHLNGQPITFSGPVDAESQGIVLVHQEILLAPDLTVAQNLFLGREIRRFGFVDDAAMRERARAILRELGTGIDPDRQVRRLSIADRQLVQIARALLVPHKVVVFDEPTAVLTPIEAESLFEIIRQLRAQGVAVLYISHRLNEVKAIADRVTVLRDGRHVATRDIEGLEPIEMARLMVGRDMSKLYPEKPATASDQVASDRARHGGAGLRGECVLQPASRRDPRLRRPDRCRPHGTVRGHRRPSPGHGTIALDGKQVHFRDAREAMASGIVYLSEDRKGKGLLLQQNLRVNLTLAALENFTRGSFIDVAAEEQALDKAIKDFDIRTRRRDLLAGQLSGGNQQKLLLAKMMLVEPRIVIIDEPTRGVDIGTKEQIYRFIAALAAEGRAVVVISSEMQELIGLCHRVVVMRNGRVAGEVAQGDLTEDAIVYLATGVHEERAAEIAAGHA